MLRRVVVAAVLVGARGAAAPVLCPSDAQGGAFVGLASDPGVFVVNPPKDGGPERWVLVDAAGTSDEKRVANSFTGQYMQVLPDDGDDYNRVNSEASFVWTSLEVSVRVKVAGAFSLFVRWSGGDTVGGGDSFYVALADAKSGAFVRGSPTWREAKVGIHEVPGQFAGCCYSMTTHACPCSADDTMAECGAGGGYWLEAKDAGSRGVTCDVGPGDMESMAPLWYEFAGQAYGNVMDFDSEPWDATCEAEGSGTHDSGHDEATWVLAKGDYVLKFFPREDGTAIDAVYLAPFGAPPPTGLRLATGASSTCASSSSSSSSSSWSTPVRVAAAVAIAAAVLAVTVATYCAFPNVHAAVRNAVYGPWGGRGHGEDDSGATYVHMHRSTIDFSAPKPAAPLVADNPFSGGDPDEPSPAAVV